MEKMFKTIGLAAAFLSFTLVLSCGTSRRGEPFMGTAAASQPTSQPEIAKGAEVYMRHCQPCHPNGETGLGPSINNKPLPGFLMRIQIRKGLGAMPGFKKEILPPEQMDQLIAYIKAMRATDPSEEITTSVHPKQ